MLSYMYICLDTGNDGGSCTEDDLSGSDREEMPEKIAVHSEYEVCFVFTVHSNFIVYTSKLNLRKKSIIHKRNNSNIQTYAVSWRYSAQN